jgi:hypothetical protein
LGCKAQRGNNIAGYLILHFGRRAFR